MANQGATSQPEQVTLSKAELAELIQAGAQMFREAQKDPMEAQKKEAMRDRLRGEQARSKEAMRLREEGCSHLREDNTSAIAWMATSDGRVPGTCQHCGTVFHDTHPRYSELRRIPTHRGSVQYL